MPKFNFNVHANVREFGQTIGSGMSSGEVEAPDRETAEIKAKAETKRTYPGPGSLEPFHTVVTPA